MCTCCADTPSSAAGDIFASPPAEAVLAAILAVTGPPGALLIVKNYTGECPGWGPAVQGSATLYRTGHLFDQAHLRNLL